MICDKKDSKLKRKTKKELSRGGESGKGKIWNNKRVTHKEKKARDRKVNISQT